MTTPEEQAELIEKNMPYVFWCAEFYARLFPTVSLDDIIQEGRIGLAKAARDYDHSKKFISFARWHVRGRMSRFCKSACQDVRVPLSSFRRLNVDSLEAARDPHRRWEDDGLTIGETLIAPEPEIQNEYPVLLARIGGLCPTQREIIRLIFWEGLTQEAIAQRRGVTRQAVQRGYKEALARLARAGDKLREAA